MKAANQYRYYDSSSLDKLNFILNCRNLGLSIQDISSLLKELDNPNQECSKVNDLIRQHIQQLDDKIIRLMSFKNQLDALENSCGTDRQIKNCYIIKKLESTDSA